MTMRATIAVLGLAGVLLLASCASDPTKGYAATTTFPADIQTVAVPIFVNETLVRDIEFELTDALVKEIERRTPYKVTSPIRADSIFTGRIVQVELDHLSRSRQTGLTEEATLSVTIDFEWKDLRTNTMLVERRSYAAHGLFVPARPTAEPIEIGQFAVAEQLARDIVNEMRSDW